MLLVVVWYVFCWFVGYSDDVRIDCLCCCVGVIGGVWVYGRCGVGWGCDWFFVGVCCGGFDCGCCRLVCCLYGVSWFFGSDVVYVLVFIIGIVDCVFVNEIYGVFVFDVVIFDD